MTNSTFSTFGILVFALIYLGIAGCHVAQALAFAREPWELAAAVFYVLLAVSSLLRGGGGH